MKLQADKQNNRWPSYEIKIDKYEFVDVEWIFQLYIVGNKFKESVEIIIQQMKKNYSRLIGESV